MLKKPAVSPSPRRSALGCRRVDKGYGLCRVRSNEPGEILEHPRCSSAAGAALLCDSAFLWFSNDEASDEGEWKGKGEERRGEDGEEEEGRERERKGEEKKGMERKREETKGKK